MEFIINRFGWDNIRDSIANILSSKLIANNEIKKLEITEDDKMLDISASVIVDRENLKKIIVGKNGEMIKTIGIESRKDIEELLGRKVYLNLFVKTVPKWRDKDRYLIEFGYKDNE